MQIIELQGFVIKNEHCCVVENKEMKHLHSNCVYLDCSCAIFSSHNKPNHNIKLSQLKIAQLWSENKRTLVKLFIVI